MNWEKTLKNKNFISLDVLLLNENKIDDLKEINPVDLCDVKERTDKPYRAEEDKNRMHPEVQKICGRS